MPQGRGVLGGCGATDHTGGPCAGEASPATQRGNHGGTDTSSASGRAADPRSSTARRRRSAEAVSPSLEVRHSLLCRHRGCSHDRDPLARSFACGNREAPTEAARCGSPSLPARVDTRGLRAAARCALVRLDGPGVVSGRVDHPRPGPFGGRSPLGWRVRLERLRRLSVAVDLRLLRVELVRDPAGESVPVSVARRSRWLVAAAGSLVALVRPSPVRQSVGGVGPSRHVRLLLSR